MDKVRLRGKGKPENLKGGGKSENLKKPLVLTALHRHGADHSMTPGMDPCIVGSKVKVLCGQGQAKGRRTSRGTGECENLQWERQTAKGTAF